MPLPEPNPPKLSANAQWKSMRSKHLPPVDHFMVGDHVQLDRSINPHKGNLKMGKTYEVLDVSRGSGFIYLRLENGTVGFLKSKYFKLKYAAPDAPPAPMHGSDQYDDIMEAQRVLDLVNIKD